MIMISFKTKREKDEMLEKARKMERFAAEFVDCLENSEHDYEYDERYYRDGMDGDMMREDTQYRGMRMRSGRYSYK